MEQDKIIIRGAKENNLKNIDLDIPRNKLVVMDVIKCADWIIDLGPEGGDNGGTIVAQGTPEDIVKVPASWTGQYLKKAIEWTKKYQKKAE